MHNSRFFVISAIIVSIGVLSSLFFASSEAQRDVDLEKSDSKLAIFDKISPVLTQWQSSSDPEIFAQENGLTYANGKISVYIYLDSAESISQLPQNIEITSSADNTVVAFLDSRQITQVSQFGFVQRIGLPVMAESSPIPIVNDEILNSKEKLQSYDLYYAIIPIIAAIIIIAYFLKRKQSQRVKL